MDSSICQSLPADFWDFVDANILFTPDALRLKWHGKNREREITQIECRKRYSKKLAATLSANPHFYFPSVLAGEQSTSDALADFHAHLARSLNASSIVDLTAGLGIDALHMAAIEPATKVTALELDTDKACALALNTKDTGISVVNADCRQFLTDYDGPKFDLAFIDPARRAADGSRAFDPSDCEPDLPAMLPLIRSKARWLIAKMSPMLDVSALARLLPGTKHIYAIGTATECKELVALVDLADYATADDYAISAVTITASGISTFSFRALAERSAECRYMADMPVPGAYVYEPYPSVMKAAPFCTICQRSQLLKLHANTNLYYSPALIDGFPGEAWQIKQVFTYESKHIKRLRKTYPVIRVTTRNFDVSAADLRKKLGIRDGGDLRLFAVTIANGTKLMIIVD